jgi:hypothetical protein
MVCVNISLLSFVLYPFRPHDRKNRNQKVLHLAASSCFRPAAPQRAFSDFSRRNLTIPPSTTECPPVNNFSVESRQTIEEEDTATGAKLKSMQLEVKLYAIHKTVAFKASIKSAATSDVYTTISFEMLTHNSGRREYVRFLAFA